MIVLAVLVGLLLGALLGLALRRILVEPLRAALDARPVVARAPDPTDEPDDAPLVTVLDVLDSGPERERRPSRLPDLRPAAGPLLAAAVVAVAELLSPRLLDAAGLPLGTLRALGVLVLLGTGLVLLLPGLAARARAATASLLPRRTDAPASPVAPTALTGLAALPLAGPLLALLTPTASPADAGVIVPVTALALGLGAGLLAPGPSLRLPRAAGAGLVAAGLALAVVVSQAPALTTLPAPAPQPAASGSRADPSPPSTDDEAYSSPPSAGRLTPFTTAENVGLSRCLPGDRELASCGPAPRIRSDGWLNLTGLSAPPVLRGRPVLLTFFSATCLTCVADLQRTARLAERYPDAGFVGVHSAEYRFEDRAVAEAAVARAGVGYPVALDDDGRTFDAYRAQAWPAHYLLDGRGRVRALGFGDGSLPGLERSLRTLLAADDARMPEAVLDPDTVRVRADRATSIRSRPHQAGYAGVPRYLSTDVSAYRPLPEGQPLGTYGLQGRWTVRADSLSATSPASFLRLSYRARTVEAVVTGTGFISIVSEDGFRTVPVRGPGGLLPLASADDVAERSVRLLPSPGVRLWGFAFD